MSISVKNARLLAAAVLSIGVLLAAGGSSGVGAALASGATTAHTLKFTAHTLRSHNFKNSGVQVERDTNNGETVGFGLLNCVFQGDQASCSVQYARRGGTLFVHLTISPQDPGSGHVNGGTRQFKGATGTLTASAGPTENTTKIVIHYQN